MKHMILFTVLGICAVLLFPWTAEAAEKTSGNYQYEVLNKSKKTAAVTRIKKAGAAVKVPKKVNGYTVVQIGRMKGNTYDAFLYSGKNQCIFPKRFSGKVKQIKLPDSISKIGVQAFKGCKYLKEINLPNGLCYIGAEAMGKCRKLKNAVFPKSLKGIGTSGFYGCNALEKVVFKTNKAKIGAAAFYTGNIPAAPGKKSHLKKIVLPFTYKGQIMDGAFNGYTGSSFEWRNFTANNGAFFKRVTSLKKIIIPRKIKNAEIPRNCLNYSAKQLRIVVRAKVAGLYIGQQRWNINQVIVYGMDTVLKGDDGMGTGDRPMISAEYVKAPKGSTAWDMASNYLCPDLADADMENFEDDTMYTEENVKTKKVDVIQL